MNDEAREYPNRADPDHWEAIGFVLRDKCKDLEGGASVENLVECLRLNWKTLTDVAATKREATALELGQLEESIQAQDDARPAQDARIAELKRRR